MKKDKEIFTLEQMEAIGKMLEVYKDGVKKDIGIFISAVQRLEKEVSGLKENIKPLLLSVQSHDEKHTSHYRMLKSLIGYMRDIDTKTDALRSVAEVKGFKPEEIDNAWDALRGLRLKTDQEAIGKGDVVWVDYEGEVIDGEKKGKTFTEKNFPVRVGSKAIAFDDLLEKKFLGSTFTEEKSFPKEEYKDWEWAGNRIQFKISILKVKTSLPEA